MTPKLLITLRLMGLRSKAPRFSLKRRFDLKRAG
jgi:hypothetical protein